MKLLYISKKINESARGGTRRIMGTINYLKNKNDIHCFALTESKTDIDRVQMIYSPNILKDKKEDLSEKTFRQTKKNIKIITKSYFSFLPIGFIKILFRKFDTIFATCPVYANLQIGYLYKIVHPRCKLIIEYRDLHSFNPTYNHSLFLKIARYFEIKILRKADIIITTTAGMKNKLSRYVENEKILVVHNYITKSDYKNALKLDSIDINPNYYNIGYVGTLNSGRDPNVILKLLDVRFENKQSYLHFAGVTRNQQKYILEKINHKNHNRIKFYGGVDRMTSLQIMKSMNSLFLLINPECKISEGYGIPGKLFDYISIKNNIITDTLAFQKIKSELHLKIIHNGSEYVQFKSQLNHFLEDIFNSIFDN